MQDGEEIASYYIRGSSFRLEKILLYSVVLQKALRKAGISYYLSLIQETLLVAHLLIRGLVVQSLHAKVSLRKILNAERVHKLI